MLLAFIYYTYKDFQQSVVLYFVFAFLSPVLMVGPSIRCSFDIIAFPILLFSYLCRSSQVKKCSYTGVLLFCYLITSGLIIAFKSVVGNEDLIITTNNGIVIRLDVAKISTLKRNTQGVRLMSLKNSQVVTSFTVTEKVDGFIDSTESE